MKRAFLIALCFLALSGLRADDDVRLAQQQLKDQGFYYGEVDGQPGAETNAAIRRYQIRNGLEVTGSLNQETLSSLRSGKPVAQSAPAAQSEAPAVSNADREFLRQQASQGQSAPAPQAPSQGEKFVGNFSDEQGGGAQPQPEREQPPAGPNLGAFYARTPYETAPPQVQVDTLRRAQETLFRYGYYQDPIDGLPGPSTQRAIILFQQNARLYRTGRLDMDTLAALRLLPGHHYFAPEAPAPYAPALRGIWVH